MPVVISILIKGAKNKSLLLFCFSCVLGKTEREQKEWKDNKKKKQKKTQKRVKKICA